MFNGIYIKPFHNQRKVFLLFYLNFCSSYSFTSCVYSVQKPFHIRNVIILYWHLLTSVYRVHNKYYISFFVNSENHECSYCSGNLQPRARELFLLIRRDTCRQSREKVLTCSWPLLILHFFLNVFHYATLSCSILPSILYQSTSSLFTMTVLIRPSISLKLL